MPASLALTGATGWLGQAILSELQTTHSTVRISALALPGAGPGLRARYPDLQLDVVEGDVRDAPFVLAWMESAQPDAVIHAAGIIHPRTPDEFASVNSRGTQHVCDAARQTGVVRFVHISSNSPFGLNASPIDVFTANEPYNPYMGYGHSKMQAELAVREISRSGTMTAVILRPPWFYGPNQPERQATFLSLVRKGRFPVPGDGSQRRSMVFVPDLARAALAATTEQATPGEYWIADASPYALTDIVRLTQEALTAEGLPVRPGFRSIPEWVSAAARKVDGVAQSRGRYSAQIHVLGELGATIACEVGPAREALGWSPGPGLVSGMRAAIQDWVGRGLPIN